MNNVYTRVHLYVFNFEECTVLKAGTVEFLACIPLGLLLSAFSALCYTEKVEGLR